MASLRPLHFRVDPRTTASGSFLTQGSRRPTCWARPCLFLSSKGKGLRVSAMVKGSDAADDDGAAADVNSLETLKERSKKVLAIQKDLLQEVAERRKLVSSIKSSAISSEQDSVPPDKSDRTSSNETLERKYSGSILSNGSVQSTKARFSDPPGGYDGSSFEKEKEAASNINNKNMTSNVTRQVKDSYPESNKSKILSPSIFEVSKLLEDDNAEVMGEVNTHFNVESDVVAEETVHSPPLAGENVMNVLVVTAECAPWSKTGGLGDVAGALPKALAKRGHRVMVVVPRYSNYAEAKDTGVRKRYNVAGQDMEVTYFHAYIDGVDFVFIDHSVFRHYEKNIYAGDRLELLKRMVLFCKAAVEVPWHVPCGGVCYGDGNLVFLANDWHTALVPVYLKAYYQNQGLMNYARSVLVIHNIAHQGRGPVDDFYSVDLPEHYINLFKLYDPLGGDHFNVFAAGLKCADRIVTVSHGYAWELTTPEGGWGLHRIINENEWKIQGIVNGIDTEDWNPSLNMHLKTDGYTNYSLETLDTGKPTCKAALQRELGLPVRDDVPIIAFIGRLDPQKGVDLIGEAVPWIVEKDVQLVMLGSGRPDLEDMLRRLEGEHRDKVRGWVGFSVRMAHRITAGADILLMPSRFEPCGLNQLYAMNYGTVPVVHAVGGLRDTVGQFDPYSESGYGWTFPRAEAGELIHALGNCLHTYWNYKSSWKGLQRRGMMLDLSWDNAAQQYEEVFIAAKYQW